jgi:biopolymer transport protein ExbD
MRLKNQHKRNEMPELNLVPMMDVVMTILIFFVLVSMSLSNFQAVDVSLPSSEKGSSGNVPVEPLVVGVDRQGQMIINSVVVNESQMGQQVVTFLQQNPKGTVVLKADKALSYDQVVKAIGVLRDVGGDRVSLAVE